MFDVRGSMFEVRCQDLNLEPRTSNLARFFEMHVACHDCKLLLSLSGGFSVGGRHGCFAALAAKNRGDLAT
jgi:hypothetical protein